MSSFNRLLIVVYVCLFRVKYFLKMPRGDGGLGDCDEFNGFYRYTVILLLFDMMVSP